MEHVKGERKLQQLEEFLQDLFFQSKSEEELNLIVEILLEIRSSAARTATMKNQGAFSDDRVPLVEWMRDSPKREIREMEIGRKLRELREAKNLSQGDIEKKTGLLRCYTSRVENGYTVPSVQTLEKYARALEVPLYRFFTEGQTVKGLDLPSGTANGDVWGSRGKERRQLRLFTRALSRMNPRKQKILFAVANRLARRD
jgi:transcriptional regulator with XRE-family HTH domain